MSEPLPELKDISDTLDSYPEPELEPLPINEPLPDSEP